MRNSFSYILFLFPYLSSFILQMQMIMDAEVNFNSKNRTRHDLLKLKLVAVEKNVNAVVTLRYRNCTEYVH